MGRRCEEFVGVAVFHDAAGVHHGDGVGDPACGGQVVRDEHDGGAVVAATAQQVEGVVDQRPVQPGGGLVGDEQRRVGCQRERGDQALRHAAGQLVGVAVQVRRVEPDVDSEVVGVGAVTAVRPQRLGEQSPSGADRVQGGGRALRDQPDPTPAYPPGQVALAAGDQVDRVGAGVVQHGVAGGRGVAGQEAEQGVGQDGLAAAGLAHDGQQFAGPDGEAEIADRAHACVPEPELDAEAVDGEQRPGHHGAGRRRSGNGFGGGHRCSSARTRGSRRSRQRAARTAMARVTTTMTAPGARLAHQAPVSSDP